MSVHTTLHSVQTFLLKLGINNDGIKIYTALLKNSPLSIMTLSKAAGIERTKLYRMLDGLVELGIIEEIKGQYKRLFVAADTDAIAYLVQQQKKKSEELLIAFTDISKYVDSFKKKNTTTSVHFYEGIVGIRHMLWNELAAKGESLCFIYKVYDFFVGEKFFGLWAQEFGKRKLTSREIRTTIFDESFAQKKAEVAYHFTNVTIRFLSASEFPIPHGLTIYNDVVAIYDFWDNRIFGLEIHNERVAAMQRLFFETYWSLAKPDPTKKYEKKIIRQY